ncbi:hypothetical protein [Dokdonia sp. Asnod3-C12]|uniref:hypothetical protein n=1 Tax=Dokdonia sp. Asnod3-C12 TaxID=3160575 RepID=UPI003863AD5F
MQRIIVLVGLILMCTQCSSNDGSSDDAVEVTVPVVTPTDETDDDGTTDEDNALDTEAFSFEPNLVIENSFNTGGCIPGPCDTDDENLDDIFESGQPDDEYFYSSNNGTILNLKCQLEKGRRTEFKQSSEGSLTTPSRMEFEAVYLDIPTEGITIAQVHNRGGSSNKPFFRLELHNDELETVVRRDPEVSSSDTEFDKDFYSFVNGANYNAEPLKIIIEKGNGVVHLIVAQGGQTLIDDTYSPEVGTNWIEDNGIANGYYLKAGIYNPAANHTEAIELQYSMFHFTSEDEN